MENLSQKEMLKRICDRLFYFWRLAYWDRDSEEMHWASKAKDAFLEEFSSDDHSKLQ